MGTLKETLLSLEFRQRGDLSSRDCAVASDTYTPDVCQCDQAMSLVPEPDYLGSNLN